MSAKPRLSEGPLRSDRLAEAIREVATGYLKSPRDLEEMTEALVTTLRGRFSIGARVSRPRRDTPLALSQRLPETGVTWDYVNRGKTYSIHVVSVATVECVVDGELRRFRTLKALAKSILGYAPAVGGWRFFFGSLSPSEVNTRYKRV
jgi:hypothetical protein